MLKLCSNNFSTSKIQSVFLNTCIYEFLVSTLKYSSGTSSLTPPLYLDYLLLPGNIRLVLYPILAPLKPLLMKLLPANVVLSFPLLRLLCYVKQGVLHCQYQAIHLLVPLYTTCVQTSKLLSSKICTIIFSFLARYQWITCHQQGLPGSTSRSACSVASENYDSLKAKIITKFQDTLSDDLSPEPMEIPGKAMHIYLPPHAIPSQISIAHLVPRCMQHAATQVITDFLKKQVITKVNKPTQWCAPGFFCPQTKWNLSLFRH